GGDGGQGDVPGLLPAVRAVDLRGLVKAHVHGGECREVDDRAPAGGAPDVLEDVHGPQPVRVGEEADRLPAEGDDEVVDRTAVGGEHDVEDRDHDHPGHEVRDVDDG